MVKNDAEELGSVYLTKVASSQRAYDQLNPDKCYWQDVTHGIDSD